MRTYESIFVVTTEVSSEVAVKSVEKVEELINKANGEVLSKDDWGKRKLAYPVKKQKYGYTHRVLFKAPIETLSEIEDSFRHEEKVIKYMTVRVDEKELENGELMSMVPVALDSPDLGKRRR